MSDEKGFETHKMSQTETHSMVKTQNPNPSDREMKEISPGLEPKKLPDAGESEQKSTKTMHILPGSETGSIEGCEQGPCPCTGPDCNDGGGMGSRGYSD